MSDGLFCTKQASQFHPGGGLNTSPNPAEELREEVVVMAVGGEEEAVVCCGALSGQGPVWTAEVKPGRTKRKPILNNEGSKYHQCVILLHLTRCFEKIQHAALLQGLGWFKKTIRFICAFAGRWLHWKNPKTKQAFKDHKSAELLFLKSIDHINLTEL